MENEILVQWKLKPEPKKFGPIYNSGLPIPAKAPFDRIGYQLDGKNVLKTMLFDKIIE